MKYLKLRILSGNVLKIIASISMLIDHIGIIFFPSHIIFRIIGRLSFPIFAFMIAEGCKYTKNKTRYFLNVFVLGIICLLVYYIYSGDIEGSILITFSLSILMIYGLQNLKKTLCLPKKRIFSIVFSFLLFVSSVVISYFICKYMYVDYGFMGTLVPLFASLLHIPKNCSNTLVKKLDHNICHVTLMGIILYFMITTNGTIQVFAFLALPLLLLYSGRRGKYNLKYFFYVFYPLHLVLLEIIYIIINS